MNDQARSGLSGFTIEDTEGLEVSAEFRGGAVEDACKTQPVGGIDVRLRVVNEDTIFRLAVDALQEKTVDILTCFGCADHAGEEVIFRYGRKVYFSLTHGKVSADQLLKPYTG